MRDYEDACLSENMSFLKYTEVILHLEEEVTYD